MSAFYTERTPESAHHFSMLETGTVSDDAAAALGPLAVEVAARAVTIDRRSVHDELAHSYEVPLETQQLRAEQMQRLLRAHNKEIREAIVDNSRPDTSEGERTTSLLHLIDEGSEEELRNEGLDFTQSWLVDIAARYAEKKPLMTYAMYATASTQLQEHAGVAGLDIGRALAKLMPFTPARQIVHTDDIYDAITGDRLTPEERDAYSLNVIGALKECGIMPTFEKAGRTYLIKRASDLALRMGGFSDILRGGYVEVLGTHSQRFRPDQKYLRQEGLSDERKETLLKDGIMLSHADGMPTLAARLAAAIHDPLNTKYMHLFVVDSRDKQAYEEAQLMLSNVSEDYHTLFRPAYIDFERISPDIAAYGVSKRLEQAAGELLHALEQYAAAPEMTLEEAKRYLHQEYGDGVKEEYPHGIHPIDVESVERLISMLPGLFPQGIRGRIAIPGWGQYSFLGQALAHYAHEGVFIEASDVSPGNLAMALGWKAGELEDSLMEIGVRFEDLMMQVGGREYGERYWGSEKLARELLVPSYGDITKLPRNTYEVIAESYVSCSISWSKQRFWDTIKTKADALTMSRYATLIAYHVVGSKSWLGRFPSVPLTEEDVPMAYRDAGMDARVTTLVETHNGRKVLLVVARPAGFSIADLHNVLGLEFLRSPRHFHSTPKNIA